MNTAVSRPLGRVLSVEADTLLRAVLVSLFRSEGIDVVLCDSLVEVLSVTDASPSDVAIVDSWCGTRPAMLAAGQQALSALAGILPVIVLADEATSDGKDAAVAIFPKPFDIEVLLETVTRCLRTPVGSMPAPHDRR